MSVLAMTIHFRDDLLQVQREMLAKEVRLFDGVSSARFSSKINYEMLVKYDFESITAGKILNRVRLYVVKPNWTDGILI